MKRTYQITGALFLVFSVLVVREAIDLEFYTPLGPGPGFFPFWIAIVLGLLAAISIYHATFGETPPMPEDFFAERTGYLRLAAIVLALAATVVLIERLGFRLTMLAFYLFLLIALGRQNPIVTVLAALAGSFGVFYAFETWLKIPLPVGIFGV